MSIQAMLKNPSYIWQDPRLYYSKRRKEIHKTTSGMDLRYRTLHQQLFTSELFEAAQKQLQVNRDKSPRNAKYEYLLHGHIRCRQCGRSYYGSFASTIRKSKRYVRRYYHCSGKIKMCAPVNRCQNKNWNAVKLESMVWAEIERILIHPEIIITELEKQHHDADQMGMLETELNQTERYLKAVRP